MRFLILFITFIILAGNVFCNTGVTQGGWVKEGYYFTGISLINSNNEEISILDQPKWWYFIDNESRSSGSISELFSSEIPNGTYIGLKATITKWGVKGFAVINGKTWYTTDSSSGNFATDNQALYKEWIYDFSSTPNISLSEFSEPKVVNGSLSFTRLYLSDSNQIYYDNNSSNYSNNIYFQKEYIVNYTGFSLPKEIRRIKYTASDGSDTLIGEVDILVDENDEIIEISYHRGSNVDTSLIRTDGSGDSDDFTHSNSAFTLTASDSDTELYKFYGTYNCANKVATLEKIEELNGSGAVVDNHTAGVAHNGVLQKDGYTLYDNGTVECITLNYSN